MNIRLTFQSYLWYQSHVNSCGEWDSMQASKEAIPHFLAEMKRKTGSFTLDDLPKLNPEVRKFSKTLIDPESSKKNKKRKTQKKTFISKIKALRSSF